jgi:acyl-CoA synthetase (NDP forming)
VDLAIVLVPHQQAMEVVRQCVAKRVKGAVLFSAGYRETGSGRGAELEKSLARTARAGGMRLIGPNGMGLYAPGSKLAFFPGLPHETGPIGVISHSGSLANILAFRAPELGIRFSKVVSSGNECDLTAADFFSYLTADRETRVIGAYLEGVRDGRRFMDALRRASLHKPVVVWKVGLNHEGARAAGSHTGALAGSAGIWRAVAAQTGAVSVTGFEAWVDAMKAFAMLPGACARRIAVVSGPGGLAVAAAEACGREGLHLAELAAESRSAILKLLPTVGTSCRNPVDVSLAAHYHVEIFTGVARVLLEDPGVDAAVIIGNGLTPDTNRKFVAGIRQLRRKSSTKPLVLVKTAGLDERLQQELHGLGVPVFESAERAMHTLALTQRYRKWCRARRSARDRRR